MQVFLFICVFIQKGDSSKQRGDLACFRILIHILLRIRVLSYWSVILRNVCLALKAFCFRQARLKLCCRGLWALWQCKASAWISAAFVKFLNRRQSKENNLSKKGLVSFIKEIRLGCLFLIMLLDLKKPQTCLIWQHCGSQRCSWLPGS